MGLEGQKVESAGEQQIIAPLFLLLVVFVLESHIN